MTPECLGDAACEVDMAYGGVLAEYANDVGKGEIVEVVDDGFVGVAAENFVVLGFFKVGIVDRCDEICEGDAVRLTKLLPLLWACI